MSRKQDRYTSRPRSLTSHYGSSPSMLGSMIGGQYSSPYSNSYSNVYSPGTYRNYNPYTIGLGRPSNMGIYGGTSSGYGGVYLSGASIGSLNLMTPVLKKIDKKLVASQKNFKPKPVPLLPVKAPPEASPEKEVEAPPVRPERKSRTTKRNNELNKERSRSLTDLDSVASFTSRSLSLNSLASDGYCVR
ncbi:jg22014 [Pararge aegeria aegeria]|uniref:Jg22014 protein n=1 Tax=Pararge aegeria aegeria TaxID=348720 RepID=A0A8S4QNV4_9NEOP|nr:jg22014 [Pararge aegeria aegeria]